MRQRHEKSVLFLCTGNYYRSRFAEVLFNSVAGKMGLPWRASSRGLALERGVHNVGPMAVAAVKALEARGLRAVPEFGRFPIRATEEDFEAAHWIVALKEAGELKASHTEYHTTWDPEYYGLLAIFGGALKAGPVEYDSHAEDVGGLVQQPAGAPQQGVGARVGQASGAGAVHGGLAGWKATGSPAVAVVHRCGGRPARCGVWGCARMLPRPPTPVHARGTTGGLNPDLPPPACETFGNPTTDVAARKGGPMPHGRGPGTFSRPGLQA
jgi:protein-tyrosine-phosphatase